MQNKPTVEQQINTDIATLRAQFRDTGALYREVCGLLFFRYGVTPTANRLYQLVRKGSMSAPAAALSKFWNELREKSRLRIEHPDLPEELKSVASDFAGTFWAKAQAAAEESLTVFRNEAQAAVRDAETARNAARERVAIIEHELQNARQAVTESSARVSSLERELAAERAAGVALLDRVNEAQDGKAKLDNALTEARREFTAELEKHRNALQLAEERHQAAEDRALREIDHERTAAAKLQKELVKEREAIARVTERHREEITARHAEIGALKRQLGVSEGSLSEAKAAGAHLAAQLDAVRDQLSAAIAQASAAQAEATSFKGQLEEAKRAAAAFVETRAAQKRPLRPQKARAGSRKRRTRQIKIA